MNIKIINLNKNKEYFYLLGVLLGDGNIKKDGIRIFVKDRDFIEKCQKCIKKCLNEEVRIKWRKNNGFGKKSYLWGVLYHSKTLVKIIQEDIKNLKNQENQEKMIAFLEGIYDSEGCVDEKRKRIRLSMRIIFAKQIIQTISNFLKSLKINHKIRIFKEKNKRWLIIDINGENVINFAKLIKFSIKRKQERLKVHQKYFKREKEFKNKKRQETLILSENEWCKKYDLTRNQYYRNKRVLKSI